MRTLITVGFILCSVVAGLLGDPTGKAKDNGADPEKTRLKVQQSGKGGWYLLVSLPQNSRRDDRLVLIHASDKDVKDPAELMLVPAGNVDKAVQECKQLAEKVGGGNISIRQANRVDNGVFDFVSEVNTHGKRGVYAASTVTKGQHRGVSVTYFHVRDWATDKQGDVEVPLPTAPPGQVEYVPLTCDLSMWLVTKDGRRIAEGRIRIVRKQG